MMTSIVGQKNLISNRKMNARHKKKLSIRNVVKATVKKGVPVIIKRELSAVRVQVMLSNVRLQYVFYGPQSSIVFRASHLCIVPSAGIFILK